MKFIAFGFNAHFEAILLSWNFIGERSERFSNFFHFIISRFAVFLWSHYQDTTGVQFHCSFDGWIEFQRFLCVAQATWVSFYWSCVAKAWFILKEKREKKIKTKNFDWIDFCSFIRSIDYCWTGWNKAKCKTSEKETTKKLNSSEFMLFVYSQMFFFSIAHCSVRLTHILEHLQCHCRCCCWWTRFAWINSRASCAFKSAVHFAVLRLVVVCHTRTHKWHGRRHRHSTFYRVAFLFRSFTVVVHKSFAANCTRCVCRKQKFCNSFDATHSKTVLCSRQEHNLVDWFFVQIAVNVVVLIAIIDAATTKSPSSWIFPSCVWFRTRKATTIRNVCATKRKEDNIMAEA